MNTGKHVKKYFKIKMSQLIFYFAMLSSSNLTCCTKKFRNTVLLLLVLVLLLSLKVHDLGRFQLRLIELNKYKMLPTSP